MKAGKGWNDQPLRDAMVYDAELKILESRNEEMVMRGTPRRLIMSRYLGRYLCAYECMLA